MNEKYRENRRIEKKKEGVEMKRVTSVAVAVLLLMVMVGAASAVPRLQTYIVGSQYQNFYRQEFQSWITNNSSFDLKVVGSWNYGGQNPTSTLGGRCSRSNFDYMDCFLMVSIPHAQSGTIWINGVEMTGFGKYSNTLPADARPRPSLRYHAPNGIAGGFAFKDIGRIDNTMRNAYEYSCNRIGNPGWGDEKLLEVVVSGYSWVHFDAMGVDSRGNTFTNPYSHDASYYRDNNHAIPEPGTLSLLGLGLIGMIPVLRRKKD
jgi:hypothetical protein